MTKLNSFNKFLWLLVDSRQKLATDSDKNPVEWKYTHH